MWRKCISTVCPHCVRFDSIRFDSLLHLVLIMGVFLCCAFLGRDVFSLLCFFWAWSNTNMNMKLCFWDVFLTRVMDKRFSRRAMSGVGFLVFLASHLLLFLGLSFSAFSWSCCTHTLASALQGCRWERGGPFPCTLFSKRTLIIGPCLRVPF